jgi:hypothetical protein
LELQMLIKKNVLVNAVIVAPVAAATVFADPGFMTNAGEHENLANRTSKRTAEKDADSAECFEL